MKNLNNRYMMPGDQFSVEGKRGKYTIKKQMGKGSSCMVYLAEFMDGEGNYTEHILKEYNPANMQVMRQMDGTIFVAEKQEQEFNQRMKEFEAGYRKQQELRNISGLKNVTTNIQDIFQAQGTRYIDMTSFEGIVYGEFQEKNLYSLLQRVKALTLILGSYHQAGYLHLDVKPDNILVIPETCEFVMLYDFDSVVEKEQLFQKDCLSCTKAWAAPELLNPDAHNLVCEATDLFAIGEIVFYQIMGRHSRPEEHNRFSQYKYQEECLLFRNVNVRIFEQLTEFFHHTIRNSVKQRYQSAKEVVHKLDELLLLANPKENYLISCYTSVEEFFVGREQELNMIHQQLQENSILFLTGIGGIGKSILAKQYAKQYKKLYDTIVFLTYSESILKLICDDKDLSIVNFERYKEEPMEEYCTRKLIKLKELCDERTLLIIDNLNISEFNKEEEVLWKDLLKLGCKFLFTTRMSNWSYPKLEIQQLNTSQEQLQLFGHYCNIQNAEQKGAAERIIDLVDAHTLMVELIAKQINTTFSTCVDMLQSLKENGIGKQDLFEKVRMLFNIANLSEEELYILSNMALLPTKGISARKFFTWCELENLAGIHSLLDKGWIKREADILKIHPVISAIALEILKERETNCDTFLCNIICEDVSCFHAEERLLYIELLEHIVLCLIDNLIGAGYILWLCDNLSIELSAFGRQKEALYYMEIRDSMKEFQEMEEDEPELILELNRGYIHVMEGKFQEAEKRYWEIIRVCKKIGKVETYAWARAYLNLGQLYHCYGDYNKVLNYSQVALEVFCKLQENVSVEIAFAYNNIGVAYMSMEQLEMAEQSLLEGLKILDTEGKELSRVHITLYRNLGVVYSMNEKSEQAKENMQQAQNICRLLYGDVHKETAQMYLSFGVSMQNSEHLDMAEFYLRKALEICYEIKDCNTENDVLVCLATVLYLKEELDDAEKLFLKVIASLKALEKGKTGIMALAYEKLSYLYSDIEKYNLARKYGKKALKIYKNVESRIGEKRIYFLFACICMDEDNSKEAVKYLKLTAEICKEFGKTEEESDMYGILGACCVDEKKYKKAKKYWKKEEKLRNCISNHK